MPFCVNEALYWAPPMRCAPGTACCNNQCVFPTDASCDAPRQLNPTSATVALINSSCPQPPPPAELAPHLTPDAWRACNDEWKSYITTSAATFVSHEVNYQGRAAGVWNFGFRSKCDESTGRVATNVVVLPVYDDGTSAGAPVFSVGLGHDLYSDLAIVYKVSVGAKSDHYRRAGAAAVDVVTDVDSAQALDGWDNRTEVGLWNWPVAPFGSRTVVDPTVTAFDGDSGCVNVTASTLHTQYGWSGGKPVWYYDLGTAPGAADEDGYVSTSRAIVDANRDVTVDSDDGIGFYR
ncbi:hypothetical protein HK101_004605 [Irineochytrium annulatum]|nr:hypothetical protein HK101_004605 [Irineochytrium annulatum]